MACSEMYSGLDYEKECLSIKEILSKEGFPIVACTNTTVNHKHDEDLFGIPENMELLLQRHVKTRYARIKVLNFHDNEKIKTEKGCDFISKHDSYVGKEFLIPLKYPGMFKFVRRPGSPGVYSSITQVLIDPPALLMACEDTEALDAKNLDENVIVPAETVLKPKRKFRVGIESTHFLECFDSNSSYAFRENAHINFTAVENPSLHSLFELSKDQLLPKVIRFQEINPASIVLKDKDLTSALIAILEGPIEVKGFVDRENLLCLSRQNELKTYETVLIPNSLWHIIHVQKRYFSDEDEKKIYITNHFRIPLDLDYVDKALYIMDESQCQTTWLQSPELFNEPGLSGSHAERSPAEKLKRKDDHTTDQLPTSKTGKLKSVVQMLKGKAHHGLTKLKEPFLKRTNQEGEEQIKGADAESYEPLQGHGDTDDEYTSFYQPIEGIVEDDKALRNTKGSKLTDTPRYTMLPFSDRLKSGRSNQAGRDFYTYTVNEVVGSFKMSGMDKFAIDCGLNKLDGAFFRNFDLNDFKFEPFSLNELEVLKVRKIIEEGCRSNSGTN